MANRIGCQVGRTKIVDPNMFDGNSSSNNIPVNNEDLTISVILQTFKKGRTVLSAGPKSGNSFESSRDLEVNFIDGSGINGKRVLTTNYTDLTMLGDDNTTDGAGEGLGITSIDIDFNSQLAPMIVINFIDVRGSAIFQNEENITGGKNKYATFFQLPYPLFELTIKGYYGKPVKYCLHLTKFNSKFNSKTGNFEITASFIGYTYAMLSDMLIGYLKAIPYTTVGKERYKEINTTRNSINLPDILNLNELMIKISNVNKEIEKLTAKDEDAAQLDTIDTSKDTLLLIENNLKTFGNEVDSRAIDIKDKLDKFEYVIDTTGTNYYTTVNSSKAELLTNVQEFNKNGIVLLDEKLFTYYWNFNNVSINSLTEDNASSILNKDNTRASSIINYLNKNSFLLADDMLFNVWDLTDAYAAIDIARTNLDNNYKTAKEGLAITIKEKIKGVIGFDPTVRNIIEVFTTAVEVFMETIWTVSHEAELDTDGLRGAQLKSKFSAKPQSSDLPNTQILPWPDYREEDKDSAYTEKYLGAKGVLQIPLDVDELFFIDDLLRAFIIAQQETEKAQNITNNADTNWFPVNPLDTRLFNINVAPYARLTSTERDDVVKLMVIRAMTFLGYTNSYLSTKEIDAFIDNEYNSMVTNLADDSTGSLKMSLGSLTPEKVQGIMGEVNGVKNLVLGINNTDGYTYTLMNSYNDIRTKVSPLPIDNSFDGAWPTTNAGLINKENTTKFLTNYNNNPSYGKDDDGGIYIKIFDLTTFTTNLSLVTSSADTTTKPLVYEKLLSDKIDNVASVFAAGFNPFGGIYGIQEYSVVDWGEAGKDYSDLPLMYMFYGFVSHTGLGYSRIKSETKKTDYDYATKFKVIGQGTIASFMDNPSTHKNYNKNRENFKTISSGSADIVYPYVTQTIGGDVTSSAGYGTVYSNNNYMSLFGSRWYYGQDQGPTITPYANEAKALLFLNTLPWNDMPFEAKELNHLFNIRAGFIHAPKLWCAFVGGLLWRNNVTDSGAVDPIKWYYPASADNPLLLPNQPNNNFVAPKRAQFFNKLWVNSNTTNWNYKNYNDMLVYMPTQAKNEFKRIFLEFVNGDWVDLKKNCEIVADGTIASFESKLLNTYASVVKNSDGTASVNASIIQANFDNIATYKIISPVDRTGHATTLNSEVPRQIFLEFDTDSKGYNPSTHIINLLREEYVIANTGYKIWQKNDEIKPEKYMPIMARYADMDYFIKGIIKKFHDVQNSLTPTAIKKQREQSIFNTSDEDIIKLQLYRTCKNTFDKWLGGSDNIDNIIFQCGKGTRNAKDRELAQFYRPNDTKARLIDSFRFVDRSYGDIGDKLYINPTPVNEYLINSPNTSFYDAVGHLLASNNFNFVALPTFINYNKNEELNAIFETYPYYEEAVADGICGPTFVCVYDGQKSKHLDFGDSNYTNDGIDFQCDSQGGILRELPKDFSAAPNAYDNDVAVFSVNYSQQNQNIFKDITLDQSEFTETAESLQITDDIASKGAENNRSLAGQNIYNVYSVRSYKAEVEMMGNAMIQPMMHFQLNNIPMFHGGYLITRVKHSIKPNNMSTSFTGVRIRFPKTRLLDGVDFYMNMIDSMDLSNSSNGNATSSSVARSVPPIVKVLIDNKVINGDLDMSKASDGINKLTPVPEVKGVKYTNESIDERVLLDEAIKPFVQMLTDWVAWMKTNNFVPPPALGNGNYVAITSFFRTLAKQKGFEGSGGGVAKAGTSNHGWGIAVDIKMFSKDGKEEFHINKDTGSPKRYFDWKVNESYGWLMQNSYRYGFINPYTLRDGSGKVEEHWHFEYHGTAAKCLLAKNAKSYGNTVSVTKEMLPVVTNPKTSDGKVAVFNGCDYIYTKSGAGDSDQNRDVKCPQIITGSGNGTSPKQMYDAIKKVAVGLNSAAIAGIMGSLYQESRFDTEAYNKNGGGCGAYGLGQWRSDRQVALSDFAINKSLAINHVDAHVGYIFHELATTYKYTLSALKTVGANEVGVATRYFLGSYEMGNLGTLPKFKPEQLKTEADFKAKMKPNAEVAYEKRLNYAVQFYDMINGRKSWGTPT